MYGNNQINTFKNEFYEKDCQLQKNICLLLEKIK